MQRVECGNNWNLKEKKQFWEQKNKAFLLNEENGMHQERDAQQIRERFRRYVTDAVSGNDMVKKLALEGACRDLEFFIISLINRKFRTYTEEDPEFYADLLQAGRLGVILSLPKYDPEKSMPTTYFFPAIMHEMTTLTNSMKHNAKSHIATLKRKLQEVDKNFERYNRTPSMHDYAYNMGNSFHCIMNALAQIKTGDDSICMDDPDVVSFMDMSAEINRPEETVASDLCYNRLIQIVQEIEPDEAIVCCFLEASKGPTETTWLAEKYHRSPSEITAGILNLKNALRCHEGIRKLYPEFFRRKGQIRIPSRTCMEKTDLCHLYDAVYSGRSDSIFYEVSRNRLSDSDIGFLCRYVCEYYLHWGPEETMQKLSRTVLQTMKLDNLVEEMKLPLEISLPEKKMYLYCLMYPEYFEKYPKESFVTALYQSVIFGHGKKLPRYFLSGSYGAEQNARICLMYALQTFGNCHTAVDCIRFMSSRRAVSFLREARLYQIMNRRYKTPAAYVNDTLAMVGMLNLEDLFTDFHKKYISAQKQRIK